MALSKIVGLEVIPDTPSDRISSASLPDRIRLRLSRSNQMLCPNARSRTNGFVVGMEPLPHAAVRRAAGHKRTHSFAGSFSPFGSFFSPLIRRRFGIRIWPGPQGNLQLQRLAPG